MSNNWILRQTTNFMLWLRKYALRTKFKIRCVNSKVQIGNSSPNKWKIIQNDLHTKETFDQILYSRQQKKFNIDTIASLLPLIYAYIKSYRAAFFAYNVIMLNSMAAFLNKFVPESILSEDPLQIVLNKIAAARTRFTVRSTLTIPFYERISHNKAKLPKDVLILTKDLLTSLSDPSPPNEL